jgi:hypothetical protein
MKVEFVDLKSKEEHEKFQHVIAELMNEATKRTKEEVDALKKMYNANLEKLIEECGFLENVNIFESNCLKKPMRPSTLFYFKRNETTCLFNWKRL